MNSTGLSYGLYATNLSHDATYGATNPSLIANNQFIATRSNKYGIYHTNGQWNFINNSIYLAGTNIIMDCICLQQFQPLFYGYNNVVITNASNTQNNYPIYTANANYINPVNSVYLDYNAYYSSNNVVSNVANGLHCLLAIDLQTR